MSNLSPRWPKRHTQTPDAVGPSTYYMEESNDYKKNRAPFLSLAERKFAIGKINYCNTFYTNDIPRNIIGGSSLRSRSKRDTITIAQTPGPADYDPKYIPKKSPRKERIYVKGKRLYVCRTPYSICVAGPSVPTRIDENGYAIDRSNDYELLVKIPADEYDTTLGPAFYNVNIEDCITSRNYRGCAWAGRTGKRSGPLDHGFPGPGTYDLDKQKPFNEHDEYVREMARLYSFIPRFIEGRQIKTLKDDMPGPNQYNLSKPLGKAYMGIKKPPFISDAKRFVHKYEDSPGPDHYKIRNCVDKRKRFSMKDTFFNVEALRFSNKPPPKQPGPASYSIPSELDAKNEKQALQAGIMQPFNHSAVRTCQTYSNFLATVPSPFEYTIEHFEKTPKLADGSTFRSTTLRTGIPPQMYNAEPASYSISEAFNKNRNRKSHSTGKVPFLALAARSEAGPRNRFNPGPADYVEQPRFQTRPLSFKTSPRDTDKFIETPGPADYSINPPRIRTHNLRLKENILRTKLRLPPGKTRDSWNEERRKTKQLLTFYKPTSVNAKLSALLRSFE